MKVGEGMIDYTSADEASFHSAGYDAYITGTSYYMLSKLEGSEEVVKNFSNKIRLGGSRLF